MHVKRLGLSNIYQKNKTQSAINLAPAGFLSLSQAASSGFFTPKIMIERIYGDTEPAHIVVAHKAMEAHKAKYGEGNKFHPRIYSVAYRGRFYQIEVVTRRQTMAATVITGVRTLTKVLEVA
ncbi:DUF4060 family protein [Nissabacter archeti]